MSSTRRRTFLKSATAGVAGAAAAVAVGGKPAAALDDALPSSQKGAANGVAPLDANKKIPLSNIPTLDGKQPASVESLAIRARDRSISSSDVLDQSEAVQAAINEAARAGARLVFQAGRYMVQNVRLPSHSWIAGISTSSAYDPKTSDVQFVPVRESKEAVFWWGGSDPRRDEDQAVRLENFAMIGRSNSYGPLLHQRSGFEIQIENVFLRNCINAPGMIIDAASNCRYVDLQLQNCGTADFPALLMNEAEHPWRSSDALISNTNDFERLRIERCPNMAMSIGHGDDWNRAFAEFTRLHAPHFETNAPATATGPLLRVGNIRSLDIVAPMMFAGPGGAISHEQSDNGTNIHAGRGDGDYGGITLVAGTVIGRAKNPYGVRLSRGNGFYAVGTRFIRYAVDGAAVKIESTYGPDVVVGTNLHQYGMLAGKGPDGQTRPGMLRDVLDERGDAWAPTGKVDPPSGTGATLTATGTDRRGSFEVKTGTGVAAGPQGSVLFRRVMGRPPRSVVLMPRNDAAAKVGAWVVKTWPTSFQLSFANAPKESTSYLFDYMVD